jgi:peptide/nickel transport system ATP-binding protein
MSILGLLPKSTTKTDGTIRFRGLNLVGLPDAEYIKIRWKELSAVFQKSMTSLSPVHKIRRQMSDIYRVHVPKASDDECGEVALRLLTKVNLRREFMTCIPISSRRDAAENIHRALPDV